MAYETCNRLQETYEQTIPDRLPLPVISDILRSLGTTNKLFSTMDIKSAFWQIELDEASRPLTIFSTPSGHYHFRGMAFGLSNSPLTYMRLMNNTIHGLIGNTKPSFLQTCSCRFRDHVRKMSSLTRCIPRSSN